MSAGRHQRRPQLVGRLRGDEYLEPVFSGVPGARDRRADPRDLAGGEAVVPDGREIDVGQGLHDVEGQRSLDREQGVPRAGVHGHRVADARDAVLNPPEARLDVGGVDHQQEVVVGQPVHQEGVEERALGRRESRVLRLPDVEAARVVGRHALHGGEGVRPRDLDLAHVADVEQPGGPAHREVLVGDTAVPEGHLPARERHHLRPEGDVTSMQGRLEPGGNRGVGHGTVRIGRGGRCPPEVPAAE